MWNLPTGHLKKDTGRGKAKKTRAGSQGGQGVSLHGAFIPQGGWTYLHRYTEMESAPSQVPACLADIKEKPQGEI